MTQQSYDIYQTLKDIILPLMTDYQTDLIKHDRAAIIGAPNMPFLHYAGPTGTTLLMLYPYDSEVYPKHGELVPYLFGKVDRYKILDGVIQMAEYHIKERYYAKWVHHFDGKKLRSITHGRALEMAKRYQREVLKQWRVEAVQ